MFDKDVVAKPLFNIVVAHTIKQKHTIMNYYAIFSEREKFMRAILGFLFTRIYE